MYVCLGLLLGSCTGNRSARRMPSLAETFSKKDDKPFGAEIAYRQVAALYTEPVVQSSNKGFKNAWLNMSDTSALYICITPRLYINSEEAEAMMEFVEAGNSLFIATGYIDELLLKQTGNQVFYANAALEKRLGLMKDTKLRSAPFPADDYAYYYYPFQNYFTVIDSSRTRVLGTGERGRPNFIVYFHGRGKLFLHCEPRAFSNYFLLKDNNRDYLSNVLAYTPEDPQHVYWDDYYHKRRTRKNSKNNFSTFSEIMKHPPLAAAFWLALLLLLLYILFGGKRLQRVIEKRKPNENTTVTFTETIGRLYLQKRDNKNIAEKMITYFNEYIRNTYFLSNNLVADDYVAMLSRKSGVEQDKVEALYRTMKATQESAVVSDYQLLSLHELIQNFHKNRI